MKLSIAFLFALLLLCGMASAQIPYAFMPDARQQFVDANGVPLAGGFLWSWNSGTSVAAATYHLDTLGNITPNTNPIILDSTGTAEVRLLPQAYRFRLEDSSHTQIWQIDNVADVGQLAYLNAVLLNPVGAALQTIVGPLAASWFVGNTAHTTSPGVRVALLDPNSTFDTATNPPGFQMLAPAAAGQTDAVPDPKSVTSNFVLSPQPGNWATLTAYALQAEIIPYTNNPCHFEFAVAVAGTSGGPAPTWSTLPCASSTRTVTDGTVTWTQQGLPLQPSDWTTVLAYPLYSEILPVTNNPCNYLFLATVAGTSGASNPTFNTLPCSGAIVTVTDGTVTWTGQGVFNSNLLDCTQAGITCKRTAYFYLEGAGCNNTTPGLGWDTFGTNSPTPFCITGTNIQKGVMAFPSAATRLQENTGTGAAATTCTTTYPAATVAGDLLEVEIGVDGSKTVSGVTDGTNAYTRAIAKTNGATDLEIWYFNGNSTGMAAASTLTVTLSAAANCALDWKEYGGILTAAMLDQTASNSGTGTAVTTTSTAGTAQATELILAAVASPSNPTVTPSSGMTGHSTVQQSANITVFSEGRIQQVSAPQGESMQLGTSQAWASAIITFKANVAASSTAQRQIALPSTFLSSAPVNSLIKWQTKQTPTGASNVVLGAALVCTADGATDDPAFNAATTATAAVSPTGPVLVSTPLLNIAAAGCAPSNLLHYQISRARYNAADVFEGFVYIDGASLSFGISQ